MRETMTADKLNDVMQFESVIEVHEDGTVSGTDKYRAPELYMEVDKDGQSIHADDSDIIGQAEREGWELLTGYSGQYSYRGPVMADAEYIGGGLARDILAEPGIYVSVIVNVTAPEDAPNAEEIEETPAGWAVARRIK